MRMDKIESVHCALNFSLEFFYIDLFLKVTHILKQISQIIILSIIVFFKIDFCSYWAI